MKNILAISAALLLSAPAFAHEAKGPHGGRLVDAGKMHVELVAKGAAVEVYVSDAAGKPVDAAAFKGLAILLIGGKPARIPLAPAGGDRLTGAASADLGPAPKGAVQITTADGATSQGKFD